MDITLLGRKIPVEYCSQLRLDVLTSSQGALGYFDGDMIYILQSMPEDKQERVLRHEKAHAILSITGLTNLLEDNLEEAICDAMEGLI